MANIVVVATGSYNAVKPEWLNDKQAIIDVGMHRHQDGTVHGDVNFNEAVKKVQFITPVPGGIGPMTIAMLLKNTLHAATIHLNN
jgi:methylenetetrahydrofolate dehydrogenase (NADP+)/methenyltetrahydrofolate cyclohydrolase